MTTSQYHWGTGRRKSAVARVRLRPNGSGKITVNKRPFEEYFVRDLDQAQIMAPLNLNDAKSTFDVFVNVSGGGMAGQAGATRLGIARALCEADKDRFYTDLKDGGYLTRDARQVERKKPGKKGARASFQFSKR